MPNVPFKNTPYGKGLAGAMLARKPTIATLGESHGERLVFAIHYALHRHYSADVTFDHRTYANGGQQFGVGGTMTDHLLATQIPQFQQRPADIAFISSGFNDFSNNVAPAIVRDNVLTAANACLAAGAIMVVLCSIPQIGGNAGEYARTMALDAMYRKLVADNPRLRFLPVGELTTNPTTGGWRGSAANNTFGSYTSDGVHLSMRGARAIAPGIADILRAIAPERIPRLVLPGGDYDPANQPYSNMLGDAGAIMGTQGLFQYGFNTGVAGVGANSRIAINWSGSVVPTMSIVTPASEGGRRKQRIAFNGGSGGVLQVSLFPQANTYNNGDASRRCDMEAVIDYTNVTGLEGAWIRPLDNAAYETQHKGQATADRFDDNLTERHFIYNTFPVPVPGSGSCGLSMFFAFDGAATMSGSIDVSQISAMLV